MKIENISWKRWNWEIFRGVWTIFGNRGKSETEEMLIHCLRGDGRPYSWLTDDTVGQTQRPRWRSFSWLPTT